jgi:hypothetical protein
MLLKRKPAAAFRCRVQARHVCLFVRPLHAPLSSVARAMETSRDGLAMD